MVTVALKLPEASPVVLPSGVGVLWNSSASGAFLAKPPPWNVTCWPGLTFGSPTTVALVCVVAPAVVLVDLPVVVVVEHPVVVVLVVVSPPVVVVEPPAVVVVDDALVVVVVEHSVV